jgi:hypothetical protein
LEKQIKKLFLIFPLGEYHQEIKFQTFILVSLMALVMSWQKTTQKVAGAVAVISGIVMALSVGISDLFAIIAQPDEVSASTVASLGGSVTFIDRLAVLGVLVTVLGTAGLGILERSPDSPPFLNTTLQYLPVIVGFVAFTAFGSEVWEAISGGRTWDNYDDVQNSYILFLGASVVSGIASLLKR